VRGGLCSEVARLAGELHDPSRRWAELTEFTRLANISRDVEPVDVTKPEAFEEASRVLREQEDFLGSVTAGSRDHFSSERSSNAFPSPARNDDERSKKSARTKGFEPDGAGQHTAAFGYQEALEVRLDVFRQPRLAQEAEDSRKVIGATGANAKLAHPQEESGAQHEAKGESAFGRSADP
jgi:hypothetical protein